MMSLHHITVPLLKAYVVIALAGATLLSPLALSFIPVLLLAWYVYLWHSRFGQLVELLTEFFMYFAIGLLFSPWAIAPFSLLISMPVLVLVHLRLGEAAELAVYRETEHRRWPTDLGLALPLITVLVLVVSLLFGSLSLLISSATSVVYLAAMVMAIFRGLPLKPVEESQIQGRAVAGSKANLQITLASRTGIGGWLFLRSPYEWLKVSPNRIQLKTRGMTTRMIFSPELSGPSVIKLRGQATDRWGLFRVNFELEPVRLFVIPRAKYAAWLARKYMAGTKSGTLPLISNIAALKPTYGLRRGIEYYGSREYQPGDSLRNIDWKHSLKYNQLISREFTEFHGRSAVILINLAVTNAEEADKLAYNIIVTAISLSKENIPSALAAYDHESVKLTTGLLSAQQLVQQSIRIAREITTLADYKRYLTPPDVSRLRANINRIQLGEGQASRALAQLLRLEYETIGRNARLNPATRALSRTLTRVDKQSNVVIVSRYNHDAEALAFNVFELTRRGNAVITV